MLLFLDGMQHLSTQQVITKYDALSHMASGVISVYNSANKWGDSSRVYAIRAGVNAPVLGANFSALGAQSWVGLGINFKADGGSDNSNKHTVLEVRDTTGASVVRLAHQLLAHFVLDIGSDLTSFTSVTATAYSAASTAWHLIEMAVSYGASGGVQVYLSGVELVSYTGSVLTSAGTGIALGYWGTVRLVATHTTLYQDFYVINNATPGISTLIGSAMRVRTHWASADTGTSAWVPNTGTDHSTLLRESKDPASAIGHDASVTFVSAGSNLLRDLYQIDDATGLYSAAENPRGAQLTVVAQASGGTVNLNLLIELSGTVVSHTTTSAVSTSWYCHRALFTSAPGGVTWAVSRIDALTVGMETA